MAFSEANRTSVAQFARGLGRGVQRAAVSVQINVLLRGPGPLGKRALRRKAKRRFRERPGSSAGAADRRQTDTVTAGLRRSLGVTGGRGYGRAAPRGGTAEGPSDTSTSRRAAGLTASLHN